jgi:GH15 family glucan-1,4-alpha-glucosidase
MPPLDAARLDASLLVLAPLGLADPLAVAERIRPLVVEGGVHRHLDDTYYGGGQWLLLTAMLGWNEALAGDEASGRRRLEWVAAHADEDGELPEQVQDHLLHPAEYDGWVAKWGPPPSPLLWSHAIFLTLAAELP